MELYYICQACGKGFTITSKDLEDNKNAARDNMLSALGSAAGALSGNWGAAIANQQNEKQYRDLDRCPHCGSYNKRAVSLKEFQEAQKKVAGFGGVQINTNATAEALMQRIGLFLETEAWDKAEAYCDQVLDQEPDNAMAYVYKLLAKNKLSSIDGLGESTVNFTDDENYKFAVRFADSGLKETLTKYADQIEKNRTYDLALKTIYTTQDEHRFDDAIELLNSIPGYKDADDLREKAEIGKKNAVYDEAKNQMASNTLSGYNAAIEKLETIKEWKDASALIDQSHNSIQQINSRLAEEEKSRQKKKKIGILALIVCCVLAVIVAVVIKVLIPAQNYNAAVKMLESGEYDQAKAAFEKMGDYKDSKTKMLECDYGKALSDIDEGKYINAYEALVNLGDYKDSSEKADSIFSEYLSSTIKGAPLGFTVIIGRYDSNPIKWEILDKQGNKALLLSTSCVTDMPYNDKEENTTWEECSLRKWLNSDFFDQAFTDGERKNIQESKVSAEIAIPPKPLSIEAGVEAGKDTVDKVFILSQSECDKYRKIMMNAGDHDYWTRSTSCKKNNDAAIVLDVGGKDSGFYDVDSYGRKVSIDLGVRPAMWIEISN